MSIIDYSWDFAKEEFSLDLDFFNEKEQEDTQKQDVVINELKGNLNKLPFKV